MSDPKPTCPTEISPETAEDLIDWLDLMRQRLERDKNKKQVIGIVAPV